MASPCWLSITFAGCAPHGVSKEWVNEGLGPVVKNGGAQRVSELQYPLEYKEGVLRGGGSLWSVHCADGGKHGGPCRCQRAVERRIW